MKFVLEGGDAELETIRVSAVAKKIISVCEGMKDGHLITTNTLVARVRVMKGTIHQHTGQRCLTLYHTPRIAGTGYLWGSKKTVEAYREQQSEG